MTPGILLIIVGAIFAFAVRADTEAVDLQIMGLILMGGGAALIYRSRQDSGHLHETTVIDDKTNPDRSVRVVREFSADDQPADDATIDFGGLADHHEAGTPARPPTVPTQDRSPDGPPAHIATPTDEGRGRR
jgi:hypothetical protein